MEWPGNKATSGVTWEQGYKWSGMGTRLQVEWHGNKATSGVAWEQGYKWSGVSGIGADNVFF